MSRHHLLLSLVPFVVCSAAGAQQEPEGLARPGTAKVADAFRLPVPGKVKLGGLLGDRFRLSQENRLLQVNEDELLGGYRHRPGSHPWIGEHVGKWLHAASLTWACTGSAPLRAKLDRVAKGLIATQEADGYLGTYVAGQRFGLYPGADWDVWSHKYCLIGLLTYYQYTGDKEALECCRRAGDLLINTFGPGKKSILSAGTHMGMAATSVLEPVVLLYRATGDKRYLDFAEYIVSSWEEPGGPRILSSLKATHSVRKTANAKAYEMLSNLVGLCELYRATGKKEYLDAPLTAWQDIVAHRLYLTGSGSDGEHWQEDDKLPNGESAHVAETCVTVTWMQLNVELLRLTGEARFAEQLERTIYNHLLGAQNPRGDTWCYFTPLEGRKPYDAGTNCCHSSGPRGVALIPSLVYAVSDDGVVVNLYAPSEATLDLPRGGTVRISQQTDYPLDGAVTLKVTPAGAGEFTLRLRVPEWAAKTTVQVNGMAAAAAKAGEYRSLRRTWKAGDTVTLHLDTAPRLVLGDRSNTGRAAVMAGPVVLTVDEGHNQEVKPINRVTLATDDPAAFSATPRNDDAGMRIFEAKGLLLAGQDAEPKPVSLRLTPFYAAGQDGMRYQVWTPLPGTLKPAAGSLFAGGEQSRSREGNVAGDIADGDASTFVVTFNAQKADEDWFAVSLPQPVTISRVVYAHGRSFHDGGWFDTSAGKPRIQGRKTKDGPWEDLAVLDAYPQTTADKAPDLPDGKEFSVRFAPASVCALRIIGKPACGDNAAQAFSSCAELEGYSDR